MNGNNRIQGRWERLNQLRSIGVLLIVATVSLTFSKDRIASAFTMEALSQFPVTQLPIFLLFETIFFILLWMKATSGEILMLKEHLAKFIPSLPRNSFHIIVGMGLLLGLLVYYSDRIVIYSSVFVSFKLFEIWGTWVRDSRFKVGLEEAKKSAGSNRLAVVNIIESYYFKRPQLQLAVTVLFFSFVSLILGLLGETLPVKNTSKWFLIGAYSVMIVVIALNELVYMVWRHNRDSALDDSYS